MQRRLPINIRRVQRALVLDQQVDHRHRAHRRGPVQGVLAPLVPDPGGGGWLVVKEFARDVDGVLGGYEVYDCLAGIILRAGREGGGRVLII